MTARALTIAGTDSGGGAGIAADLKTFTAHGVWGLCAVTAVTAQNTVGVQSAGVLEPGLVQAQIGSVVSDIGVDATKTGMLGQARVISAVAAAIREWHLDPLIVDPVAVATTGASLLGPGGIEALRSEILPLARLVTPNLAEAAALAGCPPIEDRVAMESAGRAILGFGSDAVLVKGGHLPGEGSPDLLLVGDDDPVWLEGKRLPGRSTHGTGCVLSAAITARLARGEALGSAVEGAKEFVRRAIEQALDLGQGAGPVNPGGMHRA